MVDDRFNHLGHPCDGLADTQTFIQVIVSVGILLPFGKGTSVLQKSIFARLSNSEILVEEFLILFPVFVLLISRGLNDNANPQREFTLLL